MDTYVIILVILGFSMLSMAWMPVLTKRIKISYSILYVLFGMLVYAGVESLPSPNPFLHLDFTVHITELVVIISLMGSGLKIDEPFSLRTWKIPFRLVSITMVLNIAVIAFLAFYWLHLDLPSALLLGAVLAPTDPVLANDVQVGPPLEKGKSDVRFTLTAEAGMNDGMAFPFTWLAITVALRAQNEATLFEWFYFDLVFRILAGLAMGFILGKVIAFLIFSIPDRKKFLISRDGFIAISSTLLVYGITEMIGGYGFIAVFVCAVTLRNYELEHEFHIELHSFTDQIERMLMAIVLILFGGTLIQHVLKEVTWTYVLFGAVLVLLVRPLTAMPSMWKSDLHNKEKAVISFYGIRGIGSFFYLSFGLQKAGFQYAGELWVLVSIVVFLSIVVHGFSASAVMSKIERQFSRERKPRSKQ